MFVTNITDDYNDSLSINNNCTNNDNNIEIILPLFTIKPCGMSLICLISLMVYTLIKPLIRKKIKYSLLNENGKNFITKSSCSLYNNRA